jgi:hypothetical protein
MYKVAAEVLKTHLERAPDYVAKGMKSPKPPREADNSWPRTRGQKGLVQRLQVEGGTWRVSHGAQRVDRGRS